ncbi:NAD-dependent epimerase/dehydratase family protein [Xanthobacter sp. V4C-4]|uniref:NAD-dependent epimerase/dehydratase family protein n=1 Tax=Xanthobacter cornucopiae TaxID=3119924 RepID=UPI00372BDE78
MINVPAPQGALSATSSPSPRIALLGGTGPVGASIGAALTAAGQPFAVVSRAAGAAPGPARRTWDPGDLASVRAAVRGIDTLVYMVGVPYDAFHLHPRLMRTTLEAAQAEGVRRLLLIGTAYPFGRPHTPRVSESHPRTPHTFKGRMRKEQEDLVMEAGASGRIATSILRLPDFYGPGISRSYLADIFAAAATGRRAKVIGPIDTPHEFVFVPDVGPTVLKLLERPDAFGPAFNLGGAGTITVREVAEQAFMLVRRNPRLLVANRLLLRLAGLFDPVLRETVEMHYLMTDPVIFDDSALAAVIGPLAKTPYAQGIARCMDAAQRAARQA